MKRIIAYLIAVALLWPLPALAGQYSRPKTKAKEEPRVSEPTESHLPPGVLTDEEYEREMASAGKHIFAGFLLTSIGGITALGGSTYIVAKSDDRKTGAIISASGLALSLAGMIVTIVGYRKRNRAQSYHLSIAPAVDPETNTYALKCAIEF